MQQVGLEKKLLDLYVEYNSRCIRYVFLLKVVVILYIAEYEIINE